MRLTPPPEGGSENSRDTLNQQSKRRMEEQQKLSGVGIQFGSQPKPRPGLHIFGKVLRLKPRNGTAQGWGFCDAEGVEAGVFFNGGGAAPSPPGVQG